MHKPHLILLIALSLLTACNNHRKDPNPAITPEEDSTMTAQMADSYAREVLQAWTDSVQAATSAFYSGKRLTIGEYTMLVGWKVYGTEPADGYPLYISLHGGGGTQAYINNSQWGNQLVLYHPKNAVYLCPRAIMDTWDMHFRPECDEFYHQIILMAATHMNVNFNKVYLMGYSAGGDGVWRLAPRMADTWASASMMAGHPGNVSLVNLRNLPFMVWCGAEDDAYDRNKECASRVAELAALHEADPEGYIFEGHIVEGKPHWMDQVDTVAVDWMAQYTRNPYPTRIVWRQEEVLKPCFYWLEAPANELEQGKEVTTDLSGNTINIGKCDYSTLTLCLNDHMLDLDQEVTVTYDGRTLFSEKVARDSATIRSTLYTREDPAYIFSAKVKVDF